MKLKKRIKKLEKQIHRLNIAVVLVSQEVDDLDNSILKHEDINNEEIIEKCAKIAEDFFEDDVIEGTQIAKEIRDVMHATPVSRKGN